MRSSVVVIAALAATIAPALGLPINEFGIAARASQYRRSPDLVDSMYARDEDETFLYRREPFDLRKARIGVVVHKRSPEPYVIFNKDAPIPPACRSGVTHCLRALEDELD
ncbi:uncharacterized protein C8Q71DRAFT_774844 [Rhodofomes roseus]|uniref:Uncharacterized protein n=1 Tax=Rhodofomes roseus TaxID=34475 RepID=A0A4Y9XLT7_9APHY|nr:uncharacterized protein C8Q71DRAFT_774844 [Rhodofomes roseus]KAH9833272.1 hypothetical protein C8Q71DRAFT_774844 [Rhodofomes roseus]TFY51030.1 hypothetical protein EVJ58_g10775 [Rhodofomes roseus]